MNTRCVEILNLFINSNGEQNVEDLAKRFNISKRMIRYDIDEINSFLKENKVKEIDKKPNSPLRFILNEKEKSTINKLISNMNTGNYIFSTEERVGILLYELLSSNKECNYNVLQEKLLISKTTLVNDIRKVKLWLSKFDISIIKVSNKGFKIQAEEINIRKAMTNLLIENNKYNIIETLEKIYNNENKKIISNIKKFSINKENMAYIKELIKDVEKEFGIFSEEDFMNLVIDVLVIVNRASKNGNKDYKEDMYKNYIEDEQRDKNHEESIQLDKNYDFLKSLERIPLKPAETKSSQLVKEVFSQGRESQKEFLIKKLIKDSLEKKYEEKYPKNKLNINVEFNKVSLNGNKLSSNNLKEVYKKEYNAAVKLSNKLKDKYLIDIMDDEINIIASRILSGSKNDNDIFDSIDYFDACYIADKLIENAKSTLNKDFKMDNKLLEGLINHLKSLIFRLKYKIVSENPILETIINNYKNEFALVKKSAEFIGEKFSCELSDDEIGYLVMYIEAFIEKSKEEEKDKVKDILIVCSAGFATGRMLEAKIKNYFIVNVVGVTSVHNISRYIKNTKSKLNDKLYVDYIISSVDIEEEYNIPTIKVSPILKEEDLKRLKGIFPQRQSLNLEEDHREKEIKNTKSKNKLNEIYTEENLTIESESYTSSISSIHNSISRRNADLTSNVNAIVDINNLIEIIEKNCEILNKETLINDLEGYLNINKKEENDIYEYIKPENIQLDLEASNWQEAISLSAMPLLKSGDITEEYVKAMIDNVNKFGAYIVVDDGIAIPHAKPGDYVKSFGITISTFKTPITIGEHKDIKIFITIASVDSKKHIEMITQIMKLIEEII